MARPRAFAVIDLGSTKICTLIGEITERHELQVVGVGVAPSRGVRKGVVVDMEEAVEATAAAVERAERQSGYRIASAYLGITGPNISATNSRGVVAVSHEDGMITNDDIQRAVQAAQVITLPSHREILHTLATRFTVDGQEGIRNPVGMVGYRLEAEAHIITADSTALRNLANCFTRLGLGLDGLVLQILSTGAALLSEEEKEMGVVLANIGGGTTDIAIFLEGSVRHTAVLPVGGENITRDIAIGLQLPLAAAEALKVRSATTPDTSVDPGESVEVLGFGEGERRDISRRRLCEITQARVLEIFSRIHREMEGAGLMGLLPAGLVLTGGTADLPGIDELGRQVLALPVRIGRPKGLGGLTDSVRGPAYASSTGLLLWAAREGAASGGRRSQARTATQLSVAIKAGFQHAQDQVGRWFRAFFP